jgi:hypothetical protein
VRGIADLPCFGVELAAVVERVPAFFCRHHCGKIGIVEEPIVEDGVRCCGRTVATSERRGRTRVCHAERPKFRVLWGNLYLPGTYLMYM